MIIYQESKARYLADVDSNILKQRLVDAFRNKTGSVPSDSYVWADEYSHFARALEKTKVDDDVQVAIEYHISAAGRFRIDVLLAGNDGQRDNGLIIELKAWETAGLTDIEDMVLSPVAGGKVDQHPCVQARKYKGQILRFNQDIREQDIRLHSAAYLFNLRRRQPEPLEDMRYRSVLADSQLFLADDVTQLRQFIEKTVTSKPKKDVIFIIENGRMRPTDALIGRVSSMLDGNEEFELIDEQNIAFQVIRNQLFGKKNAGRHVFVVEGGPGTGKSVVAVRLLAEILKERRMGFFVAPNRAFRETLVEYLAKGNAGYREDGQALFRSSWSFHDVDHNIDARNDVLVVDEAHRLKNRAHMYRGKNMVEDMVRAARITIFFLDETQRVSWNDLGSIDTIKQAAQKYKSKFHEPFKLTAQYRCNGSTGYLNWLDDVLQIRETGNYDNWGAGQYEFKIFDRAEELYAALKSKNDLNKARLVAGYSWEWPSKGRERGTTIKHVQADGLSLSWNYDGENWATSVDGIEHVGCIHTSQGLEFDWLGVLIGEDLVFKDGAVVGDPQKRAKNDSSLKGWQSEFRDAKSDASKREEILVKVQGIIKSTYKVLLSRGRLGCYVWCADVELREYLKQRLTLATLSPVENNQPTEIDIINDPGADSFLTLVPLYSLEAAAGSFGEPQQIDCLGWVKAPHGIKITSRHFAAKVVGKSMEPLIPNGSYGLFRFGVEGSRANRIVLAQHSSIADPETGGSYTLKKYHSTKVSHRAHEWEHTSIQLLPLNPAFKPIEIDPQTSDEIAIIAEFITTL
jgi:DUF2075 family protein